ncbi:inner membrane protein yede [Anaeramoeba flamelloides]|uniref:Inner membrane protein yede n=1 Tax=Anaeramoeba flamelloides TaxID=1746091 RepID=A0ABQ8YPF9_9EUKA|nr:inner membrane protein yede [Anaeramoeba flamelloides]
MSLVGELSSSSTTGTGFFSSTSPLTSDSGINNNEKKKTDPYGQINFKFMIIFPLLLVVFFLLFFSFSPVYGGRQIVILVIGLLIGISLSQCKFGYTSSFRNLIAHRKGKNFRALITMFALTMWILSIIISASPNHKSWTDKTKELHLSAAPVSWTVFFGSFIFGIGMQIGSACASGCLHEVGSGIVRTLIVFIFFIVGTFIAALDWSFNVWFKAKSEGRINLIEKWGIAGGTIFQTFVFLVLVIITIAIEIKKHGLVEEKIIQRLLMKLFPKLRAIARNKSNSIESKSLLSNHTKNAKKEVVKNIFTKKHDIYVGSILLTIAQIFLYLSTSNFWGVMGVFPFLIALPLRAMNVDVEKMKYFQEYSTLPTHFFANDYIVLDLSIILGAFLSATVTGTFGKGNYRPNWKVYGSAIIAGLLLGFGSRWAYGCNVGAWTSPSIAASVSGYVWFAGGLLGNIVGVICRPYVGLKN